MQVKRWLKLCWQCGHYQRRGMRRSGKWGKSWRRVKVCNLAYVGHFAKKNDPMVASKNFVVPHECPYFMEAMLRQEKAK